MCVWIEFVVVVVVVPRTHGVLASHICLLCVGACSQASTCAVRLLSSHFWWQERKKLFMKSSPKLFPESSSQLRSSCNWSVQLPDSRFKRFVFIRILQMCLKYKECGCYLVTFSCFPSSIDHIYIFKFIANKHMYEEKPDWKLDFPLFTYGYWMCMFVDSLSEYICPPNCVHYWMWSS